MHVPLSLVIERRNEEIRFLCLKQRIELQSQYRSILCLSLIFLGFEGLKREENVMENSLKFMYVKESDKNVPIISSSKMILSSKFWAF